MMMKPKPRAAATSGQDWLVYVLCAAVAAWLASYVDNSLMANYATARFWETWISSGSPLLHWVPLITFAFFTGILLGLVIAWMFPQHAAMKVAAIAAVLQLAVAIPSGAIGTVIVLAAGLLAGALPARTR